MSIPFNGLYSGLVGSLSRQKIVVDSVAVGSYINGRYIEGASSQATMTACVYPSTGEDLKRLPEGRRNENTITVHTDDELLTAQAAGARADLVTYNGEQFEVVNSKRWDTDGFESLAQRVNQ